MNLPLSIFIMLIGSFIIQYYLTSFIIANKISDIENGLGKIYLTLIISILMSFVFTIIYDIAERIISIKYYLFFIAIFFIILILYRNQVGINEKDYLKGMIEYRSAELLISSQYLRKAKDQDIKKYAKKIIKNNNKEIIEIKEIINELS